MHYNGHKIFIDNGYPAIYLPNHPKSKQNGIIRIHILQAEKQLGRQLKDGEFVHHCDEDKTNYSMENLWVFKTNNDHAAYHYAIKYGFKYVLTQTNGVYTCNVESSRNIYCNICGNTKSNIYVQLCLICYNKLRRHRIPTKESLSYDIQHMSFTRIGQKYGVSDNAVRKWCRSYNLPCRKIDIKNFDFTSI